MPDCCWNDGTNSSSSEMAHSSSSHAEGPDASFMNRNEDVCFFGVDMANVGENPDAALMPTAMVSATESVTLMMDGRFSFVMLYICI